MSATDNIHGTGLVLDGRGVILRGPSGAGKSLLALALLDEWQARGLPASLVADDRVDVAILSGRLLMRPPERIAGLIELRGRGIVRRPYLAEAGVDLVVDLVDDPERMPEETAFATELLGVRLARAPVPRAGLTDMRHQLLLIREALDALGPQPLPARQKTT